MSGIRIFLLGKFNIEANGALMPKLESRKAEELLVYLLLRRDRPQCRERLADILWGETSEDQANNYLRKALWQLQSALEHFGLTEQGLLLVEGEWLQINPHFELWLDIALFEEAFKKSKGILGRDLEEGQAELIRQAVESYGGDLLDSWYQDWCLYERERFQHLYLAMLDKLMDYCEVWGAYEDGLMFGERILHYDRARERTHRRLMRLYYLAGDRTSALRQYRKCVTVLQEELDVQPAESTHLIYEMIRADKLDGLTQPTQTGKLKTVETNKEPLREVFSHLDAIQKELSRMQTQLAQDVRFIQRTIQRNR
jgi:DNA-binding SARP family transcriptional activator